MRTFLDSCVLIAAFRGDHGSHQAAMELISAEDKEIVLSDIVRLEVLPKAKFNKNHAEVDFYEEIFSNADEIVATTPEIISGATELVSQYGLGTFDACLAQTAIANHVAEFVTTEKPTKPYFKIVSATIFRSIYIQKN